MIRFYNLIISIVSWTVLAPWQLIRAIGRGHSLQDLTERLGHAQTAERGGKTRIIIHAVSVGEVVSTAAMLEELYRRSTHAEVVLTTGNRDGRAVAKKLQVKYPLVEHVGFLPWDRATAMRSWLNRLAPDVVAVVETEIWPNLFHACHKLGIPLCIVNGRIYERDFSRYKLLRVFFKRVLGYVDWIGTLDEIESKRFVGIGAKADTVSVVGDMKCDVVLPASANESPVLENVQPGGFFLVAGSTHPPEEIMILKIVRRLRKTFPDLRLVLAPRHLRRVQAVEDYARREGFAVARLSGLKSSADTWDVLVLDQMGRLAELYAVADLVLIGGSFSGNGGHNFLEAAVHARPIVIGPDSSNFKELTDYFLENGGLIQADSIPALESSLQGLLGEEERRSRLGRKAYQLLKTKRGAAQRYVDVVLKLAQSHRKDSPYN